MHKPESMICNQGLRDRIQSNLSSFTIRRQESNGQPQAAVAVTIVDCGYGSELPGLPVLREWSPEAGVVLTRRALDLANHAGQWALPGGRLEEGETAEEAARRELAEEVGLDLEAESVLGRLDDFVSRSGFVITPIVIWAGPSPLLSPDPVEVSSVHRVPVAELLRPDAPILDRVPGSRSPVLFMPVGNSLIAAPTAALLYQFREVAVLGGSTRVAHYEQPRFAWK